MKQTIAAIFALGLSALPALAEYPEKPIKLIVSYSAGGGSDVLARTVAQFLKAELGDGASVVVKNVPAPAARSGSRKSPRLHPMATRSVFSTCRRPWP